MEHKFVVQNKEEFLPSEDFLEPGDAYLDQGIYAKNSVEELLEDDELSFEEAAFMTGYCDFA